MKDTTTNIFYHLLLGKQPPVVEDLRIRCEGTRELKILEDACKLAAYRHYRETVLIEAHKAYYREPFMIVVHAHLKKGLSPSARLIC